MISHDRFFLDIICTHMLAFEGDAHVEWFEGNFEGYEADKIRRLGPAAHSGASGRPFRRHPVTESGASGHLRRRR